MLTYSSGRCIPRHISTSVVFGGSSPNELLQRQHLPCAGFVVVWCGAIAIPRSGTFPFLTKYECFSFVSENEKSSRRHNILPELSHISLKLAHVVNSLCSVPNSHGRRVVMDSLLLPSLCDHLPALQLFVGETKIAGRLPENAGGSP